MENLNQKSKRKRSGKIKDLSVFRYTVNLNEEENIKFLKQFDTSQFKNLSKFIRHVLLNRTIKYVKIDKAAMDYYMRLTNLYTQYNMIGVNYNQAVKALKSNFSEKRAFVLIKKLENSTLELVQVTKKVIELTNEFEEKWLQK